MRRSDRAAYAAIAIVVLLFAALMGRLFALRLSAGDVFPVYSSLRADPVGAKAFAGALARLGVTVTRNHKPLASLGDPAGKTIYFLGMRRYGVETVSLRDAAEIESVPKGGGRLVFAFYPERDIPHACRECREETSGATDNAAGAAADNAASGGAGGGSSSVSDNAARGAADNAAKPAAKKRGAGRPFRDGGDRPPRIRTVSLLERWGFAFDHVPLPEIPAEEDEEERDDEDGAAGPEDEAPESSPGPSSDNALAGAGAAGAPSAPGGGAADAGTTRAAGADAEPAEEWHTALVFDRLDKAWRVRKTRDGRPVVVERTLGAGTVVLVADGYLFSNEAMRRDRRSDLLAWTLGTNRTAVFDERHLGVAFTPGIASLARKLRLHGLLPGLLLLGVLVVWRNASSLVPPREDDPEPGSHAPGRDASSAFVYLLRRSIPERDILSACFREWRRSGRGDRKIPAERLGRAESLALAGADRTQDPAAAYRRIARILKGEET